MNVRDYTYLGTTRSLCPHCRRLVDAKIIVRNSRVYFRKTLPGTRTCRGFRLLRRRLLRPPRVQPAGPPAARVRHRSDKGCPYDCGLCPEHEQHTCIALIEITSNCNLQCPMCFAESGPGGTAHRLRDVLAHGRSLRPAGGRRRRAATVRRRADAASRSGAHGPLRLRAADPGRDDQHQRHPPGPRSRPGGAAGADARPAGDLPAIRRLGGQFLSQIARRGICWKPSWPRWKCCGATTCAARWSARWITTPICTRSAGCCNSAWSGRSSAASASSWRPTAAGTWTRATWRSAPPCPTWSKGIVAQTNGLVAESDFYPLPCAHPNCH